MAKARVRRVVGLVLVGILAAALTGCGDELSSREMHEREERMYRACIAVGGSWHSEYNAEDCTMPEGGTLG